MEEELQAWAYDPIEGEYMLGIVQDGLGWVYEKNLQLLAEQIDGTIYYFVRVITTTEI